MHNLLTSKMDISVNADIIMRWKILQMNTEELSQYLDQLAMENLLLDVDNNEQIESNELENNMEYKKDLYNVLEEDICLNLSNDLDKYVGKYLLRFVDNRGYFYGDIAEISASLKYDEEYIKKVLQKLQCVCEPPGVFARDIYECLKLQILRGEFVEKSLLLQLVDNIVLIAEYKLEKLSSILDISMSYLQEMLKIFKMLDPYPGSSLSNIPNIYLKPDVVIDKYGSIMQDNTINVLLNNDLLSEWLLLKKEKKYINKCVNEVKSVISALHYRKEKILQVVKHVYALQEGNKNKRVRLKDVGEHMQLSESMISRIVNDKYILTENGVLTSLKDFFIVGEDDERSISYMIKEIIDNEGDNTLSDQDIATSLNNRGINIARRTVAKYREKLRMLPKNVRKRKKHLGL